MAKLLFKQGDFRILSDDVSNLSSAEMNQLIKTAGTTCYQSRETTQKTPEKFIQMAQKHGHFSVLEHSWRTAELLVRRQSQISPLGFLLYQANNLFCITTRPNSLLVSGNARMFNEAFAKDSNNVTGAILNKLYHENPVLFQNPESYGSQGGDFDINSDPELETKEEILVHRAMTVEFNNCSRGFTHEDVRSRNGCNKTASYAQESTRYVDYAKGDVNLDEFQMNFVLPYCDIPLDKKYMFKVGDVWYNFTPKGFTDVIEGWYRALRKDGMKPEDARQWLPIGIKAQIVQTYNLNEWRHWFAIRTQIAAHSEIRFVSLNLLIREVQKRIPGVFDDFKVSDDGQSATYVGDDKLV